MTQAGRNSSPDPGDNNRLPREKILRGQRNFQRLFEKSTLLRSPSLHFRYRTYTNPDEKCMIGFIAPKKTFKTAVERNKAKRLMREAYRQNQQLLWSSVNQANIGLHGAFICIKKDLPYSDIERDLLSLLTKAAEKIKLTTTTGPQADQ